MRPTRADVFLALSSVTCIVAFVNYWCQPTNEAASPAPFQDVGVARREIPASFSQVSPELREDIELLLSLAMDSGAYTVIDRVPHSAVIDVTRRIKGVPPYLVKSEVFYREKVDEYEVRFVALYEQDYPEVWSQLRFEQKSYISDEEHH